METRTTSDALAQRSEGRVSQVLHGLSDDYTIWLRRTSIERYAQQYPLIIVMPDGYRGFDTNNDAGSAYATYMAEDLVKTIDRTFPTKRDRASRGIGGLSMGGYGALRLALGYPHLFAAATSHSGAVLHGSRPEPRKGGVLQPPEFHRIFGKDPTGAEHDILALAQESREAAHHLPIAFSVGRQHLRS